MWAALVGGAFALLTVIAKGLIDAGTKTSRMRRHLDADLDLLEKSRQQLADRASVADLEDRVDRRLTEYALSDLAASPGSESEPKEGPDATTWLLRQTAAKARLELVRLLTVGVVVGAVAALSASFQFIVDAAPKLTSENAEILTLVGSALIGVLVGLISLQAERRRAQRRRAQANLARMPGGSGGGTPKPS